MNLEVCLGTLSGPPEVLDLAGSPCPERHCSPSYRTPSPQPTMQPASSASGLELRDHTGVESGGESPLVLLGQ